MMLKDQKKVPPT